jgi:PBP1b-binding outer membrane lipoprotein LpoB
MKHTLIILSAFVLFGCASRKVNKTEVKETTEVKAVDTTKTVTNTETTVKSLDTSTINEIEIVPIDITKPITYNGKTVLNGVLRLKTTKVNKVVEIEEKAEQIQQKGLNNSIVIDKTIKEKQTERKSVVKWWLWILLLIPIYFIYKKFR